MVLHLLLKSVDVLLSDVFYFGVEAPAGRLLDSGPFVFHYRALGHVGDDWPVTP